MIAVKIYLVDKRVDCYKRYNTSIKGRYRRGKSGAKIRGIVWMITLEEYESIVTGKSCEYCKGPLGNVGVGLDRIDNERAYVVGNVTPCCGTCNMIKGEHLSYREMKLIAALIKSLRAEYEDKV